ncbi:MAG: carboxypeptidase regulatory-like domain-containing protein, partial [Acidobacteria bacterium]
MGKRFISSLVVLSCWILLAVGVLQAQSIYGTITGTVYDPSGAVVANANVTLKNVSSGDARRGATNSDGYYSFSSVPTGAYTLTVEAGGFQKTVTEGIAVTGAASLSFPIKLAIGAATTEVKVEGVADQIIATDSGEKSV